MRAVKAGATVIAHGGSRVFLGLGCSGAASFACPELGRTTEHGAQRPDGASWPFRHSMFPYAVLQHTMFRHTISLPKHTISLPRHTTVQRNVRPQTVLQHSVSRHTLFPRGVSRHTLFPHGVSLRSMLLHAEFRRALSPHTVLRPSGCEGYTG